MKVKLLKKVRKRFTILHCPNGIVFFDTHFDGNWYRLIDNDNEPIPNDYALVAIQKIPDVTRTITDNAFNTDREAINYLKDRIVKRLRQESWGNSTKHKNIIKAYKPINR